MNEYNVIQKCELFDAGTDLSIQKYDIKQVCKIIKQAKQEVYLSIIKDKFNGSVRDFLIWYGGDFKDIDIDLEG